MLLCVYLIVGEFGGLFYPNIVKECVMADQ